MDGRGGRLVWMELRAAGDPCCRERPGPQGGDRATLIVLSPCGNLMRRTGSRVSAGTVKLTSPDLLESPATRSLRPESGDTLTPPAFSLNVESQKFMSYLPWLVHLTEKVSVIFPA